MDVVAVVADSATVAKLALVDDVAYDALTAFNT